MRPVEHKAGTRHGRAADLQVCAQALCLEEMLGVEVPYGYVWYAATRRRSRVDFTAMLRSEVLAVVESIRGQLRLGTLPAAPNDSRCRECQLLHHCLPEISDGRDRVTRFMRRDIFGCATLNTVYVPRPHSENRAPAGFADGQAGDRNDPDTTSQHRRCGAARLGADQHRRPRRVRQEGDPGGVAQAQRCDALRCRRTTVGQCAPADGSATRLS